VHAADVEVLLGPVARSGQGEDVYDFNEREALLVGAQARVVEDDIPWLDERGQFV
jgi:hypothetical protein